MFLCCSNILYVMAFIGCILLSNFKRLRCVCFLGVGIISIDIGQKYTLIIRECVNSSLWGIEHLLILVPYLVCKVFFVSCGSCDPRGAPAPFRFYGLLVSSVSLSNNLPMLSVNASIVADCEFPTVNY